MTVVVLPSGALAMVDSLNQTLTLLDGIYAGGAAAKMRACWRY